jgi:type IV pilus assembly protein PilF
MPSFTAYNQLSSRMIDICVLSILLISFLSAGCAITTKTSKEKALAMEDMGRSFVLQGNSREGLAYFLKASEFDPNNPEIEHELALVYDDIGEYDLAIRHFKKAIALKPDFSEAVNNMGTLYSKMKEWDKALECFQQAASNILYQTPHFAYHNMGLVYFYKGDYPKAIENYQRALKLEPSYVNVYFDLASAYIALNRLEEAVEAYKKAATLSPQPWQANLSLAQLYVKLNRRQEAIDTLKLIIESNPRSQAAQEANKLLQNLNKK